MHKSYPTIFITTARKYTNPQIPAVLNFHCNKLNKLFSREKYRQQIGLSSSIRFEAPAPPLIKLSDLLNEFWSFKQKNGASEDSLYRIKFIGKYLIEACSDVKVGTINQVQPENSLTDLTA